MVHSRLPASLSVSRRLRRDLQPLLWPSKGLPLHPRPLPTRLTPMLLLTAWIKKSTPWISVSRPLRIGVPPLVRLLLAVNSNNNNRALDLLASPLLATPTSNVATARSWAMANTSATLAPLLGLPWLPPTGLPTNRLLNRLASTRS
jgi:hypothetical protein